MLELVLDAESTNDQGDRVLSDVVAEQVRRHRDRLGWRRVDLAERCAAIGWPALTESALGNLETGRRSSEGGRRREVTIDEIVVLARALGVVPLDLVTAPGVQAEVEVLPGVRVSPGRALAWLAGRAALPGEEKLNPEDPGIWATHIANSYERDEQHLREAVAQAGDTPDGRALLSVYLNFKNIWWARSAMQGRGMVPPKPAPDLAWIERVEWNMDDAWAPLDDPDQLPAGFRPGGPFAWES